MATMELSPGPTTVPLSAEHAEKLPLSEHPSASSPVAVPMTVILKDLSVEVKIEKSLIETIKQKIGLGKKDRVAADKEVEIKAGGTAEDVAGYTEPQETPDVVVRVVTSVNAVIPPGKMTAILGASGAGKTTLLNAIAARLSGSARPTGQLFFNDLDVVPLRNKGGGQRTAYVKQEEALLPYLTVRETLRYNAELRLPLSISNAAKHELVEEIILELNLKECAGSLTSGCSSGERRLVSIAVQLLSSPSLLLLDEPTSSLDSFTSYSLCQTLQKIAKEQNRTVGVWVLRLDRVFDSDQPALDRSSYPFTNPATPHLPSLTTSFSSAKVATWSTPAPPPMSRPISRTCSALRWIGR